jgi:hypothetical protein
MKNVNFWSKRKVAFGLQALVLTLALSTVACQNSNGGPAAPRTRSPINGQGPSGNSINGLQNSSNTAGVITSSYGGVFDMNSLGYFFNPSGPIGQISASASDGTGLFFRGNVNQFVNAGNIQVLAQDQTALQTGAAYTRELRVTQISVMGNTWTVIGVDDIGAVTFSGAFNGSMWQGSVSFENGGSNPNGGQSLGQFSIVACSLFNCQ